MIVCIGWGSLIWCQKQLPVEGKWHVDGPELPIEFARESRDKRITLVIAESVPTVTTLWAVLAVDSLEHAKKALAVREGINDRNVRHSIGYWSPAGPSDHPQAAVIGTWAAARAFDGAVWTALKAKMGEDDHFPSEEEVVRHLSGLTGSALDAAKEYVELAPRQIATPYRRAIEQELRWLPAGLV